MARRGGRRMGGGLGGQLFSGLWILIVIGLVFGWAQVNNIKSVGDAVEYFRAWSGEAQQCANKVAEDEAIGACTDGSGGNGGDTPIDVDPGDGGDNSDSPIPIDEKPDELMVALDKLTTAEPAVIEYDRGEWAHWLDVDKDGCNERENTLIRQGKEVKADEETCSIVSGVWVDPYSGKEITNSSSIDIDHVIPLSYAARHGGQAWPEAKKTQFANDALNLLISSATENRKKGDKGPSEYLPPRDEFLCTYSSLWVKVATKYSISLEVDDKKTLKEGLATCAR